MTIPILMPALSPTMEEGTLAKWHVKKGDVVTVTADLARDGSNFAHARIITLAGGSRVCDYDRFNGADWSCGPK